MLPLPANIVDVVPEFRGYDYFVVNDEIVIVQPSSRKVLETINADGATAMNAGATQDGRFAGQSLRDAHMAAFVVAFRHAALPRFALIIREKSIIQRLVRHLPQKAADCYRFDIDDLDAPLIGAFPDNLEHQRK